MTTDRSTAANYGWIGKKDCGEFAVECNPQLRTTVRSFSRRAALNPSEELNKPRQGSCSPPKGTSSGAEISLAVLDRHQGAGIGPLLIRHLARIAHQSGILQFEADVSGDNSRMLGVLSKSGCIISHAHGAGIVHFTLKRPELSASAANNGFNHAGRGFDSPKGDDHG